MANRQVIIKSLKLAKIKKGEIFYDLGCGNGEVLIEAAKLGAKAVGFEISPYYYLWARVRIAFFKTLILYTKPRSSGKMYIEIKFRNIFDVGLSKADVIYCYLLPKFLEKLSAKFQKELETGNRLISMGFPIKGMSKYQKFKINNRLIYLYKI